MLGAMLTWLNDHTSDVFPIFTANDITTLTSHAPEFTRAERFDALFFIDVPPEDQKNMIWDIWIKFFGKHGLKPDQWKAMPVNTEGWTGADIRACCRMATLLNATLEEASMQIVPVTVTSKENIDRLRDWAHHRCLSADYPGRYDKDARIKTMRAEQIDTRALGRRVVTRN